MEHQPNKNEEHENEFSQQDSIQADSLSQKRSYWEVLLDPQTLQGLMSAGGGLLVVGLVVWLWSVGVFENPLVVANCLGVGNIALLAVGVVGVIKTRYQLAGKATALLACLLMPLNLWFYDAQGLITLDQGGHLWVPALICCAIYVAVAYVLKEPRFAYVIVGGITLTGMLFLADQQIEHFWEITAPVTLLVVLGGICIHFERVFPEGEGPFVRSNFGKEFFRAGHILLASGLMILFAGRLSGWLYEPMLAGLNWFTAADVATQALHKFYAFALTIGGTYLYLYSHFVVREQNKYLACALLTSAWSGVVLLDLLAVPFTLEYATLFIAIAALVINAIVVLASRATEDVEKHQARVHWATTFAKVVKPYANGLNVLAVCFAGTLYARDRIDFFYQMLPYELTWVYLVAVLVGCLACWLVCELFIERVLHQKIVGCYRGSRCLQCLPCQPACLA